MSSDETRKGLLDKLEAAHRLRDSRRLKGDDGRNGRRKAFMDLVRLHDEDHRKRDAERARRSGKRPLDATAIATAGVAIADAQGVDEVSMRKIAAVLGSGTMSLYHYVRTKEDLLVLMDDLIMGEVLVDPNELKGGWRKATTAIARSTRNSFRRHPWALTIRTGGRPGIQGLRHMEQSLAALASTGLSFEDKLQMIVIVDDYVFGHALRAAETALEGESVTGNPEEIAEFFARHIDIAEFPQLKIAIGDDGISTFMQRLALAFRPEEWFDAGLEAVLDGVAGRYGLKD